MELKRGFKASDVGPIPEDWIISPLSAHAVKITDGEHQTPKRSSAGYYLLSARNIQNGYIDLSDVDYVGADEYQRIRRRCDPDPGDVLISCSGTVGRIATVPFGFECVMVRSAAFVKPSKTTLDGLFLQYFLQSWAGQRQIFASLNQGAQANLFQNHIQALQIAFPPTSIEQRAIAEALSDADALIESLEQLLAKKRQIKQGAMQELLTGKKRLPGFSEEWAVKRLEDLADIRSGGTPSTSQPQFWEGDILWCTPTDITALNGSKYLLDTNRTISAQGLKSSSAEMIPANSIVMTSRATIGECAINRVPVSTNQGFKNFVPFEDVHVEFLYYLLSTQKQRFISLCGGSTFLEIGKTQLAVFDVRIPSTKSEQTAIAAVLSDMDAEIAALETKLVKARQLKQGMMQELLTGRIRLIQPSAEVVPFPVKQRASAGTSTNHNPQINEAVVLAVLAHRFGTEQFPLGRFRRTKLSYLLHRHTERQVAGFMKKAAGPYNPHTRYGGAEKIALKNGYVRIYKTAKGEGFVAADNIDQAEGYFESWYGLQVLDWLKQFRYKKNEELELLTTVDMAIEDLRREGKSVTVPAVKQIIHDSPEWKAKLDRATFADSNITAAIESCRQLFPVEE